MDHEPAKLAAFNAGNRAIQAGTQLQRAGTNRSANSGDASFVRSGGAQIRSSTRVSDGSGAEFGALVPGANPAN